MQQAHLCHKTFSHSHILTLVSVVYGCKFNLNSGVHMFHMIVFTDGH